MWGRLFWTENTACQVSSSLGGKQGQCAGEFTCWGGETKKQWNYTFILQKADCVVCIINIITKNNYKEFVLSQLDIKTNLDRTKWMETSIKISLEKDIRKGGLTMKIHHHTTPFPDENNSHFPSSIFKYSFI